MSKLQHRDSSENQELSKTKRFLEELSWVLSSHSNLDFKALPRLIKSVLEQNAVKPQAVGGYVSSNPNKHFLVGVLPRLFIDETLFPSNDDIAEFARSVMHVEIPRFHKKSRYELIGHIVCQTNTLDDEKLRNLAKSLDVLASRADAVKTVAIKRRQGQFGWNEILQSLVTDSQP